jgi:hypothetical protein
MSEAYRHCKRVTAISRDIGYKPILSHHIMSCTIIMMVHDMMVHMAHGAIPGGVQQGTHFSVPPAVFNSLHSQILT